MTIAAIDQSFTNTGICIFETDTGELLDFTVIKTKNKQKKNDTPYEARMINIMEEILDFCEKYAVSEVVMEGLAMNRNTVMARPLAGLYYYICAELYKRSIPYENVPPKSVKKFACFGNAKKEDMGKAAPEEVQELFMSKYKKTTGFYDLIDAYFIGQFFLNSRNS